MIGRYEYPCSVELDVNGGFLTRFPDIPEAIAGAETLARLDERAVDALVTALNFCVEADEPLPVPSFASDGLSTVAVAPMVAAKLALYETMRDCAVSKGCLAWRLRRSEGYVTRLLDLHIRSDLESIGRALAALGRRVVVTVEAA
jgi:antitoxin HicB